MFILLCAVMLWAGDLHAQVMFGNTPPLHVDGKNLKDINGNTVVLHGVMDTPSAWFNNGRWGWSYDSAGMTRCIDYFDKLFTALTDTTQGAFCNVFRLHLEPAWTNDNNYHYCDKTGDGEADIQHFNPTRLKTYMKQLYWKLIQKALKHGLYVVVRPPGVCPGTIKVGDVYNKYLMEVWDIVTQNDSIRKYSGQVSIELANEPVNLNDANGKGTASAKHDFFQPIVDKIRQNGFTGIVWIPGTGYQSSYQDYVTNPITGYNIGYAVHVYTGWYGQEDKNANGSTFIKNFRNQVPVVETNPIMVTEIDWSPNNTNNIDHYNEFNQPVYKNFGTWATGSTSKWGKAWKAVHDHYGNIGMTLTSTGDFINIDKYIASKKVEPAFLDDMKKAGYEDAYEACSGACFKWYREWAQQNYPHADYTRLWTADQGNGKYKNPILNADFPDPDVIRVGNTFYMVSTTMYHFPGATILKSKDLVNWEYCANPLQQIADNNAYNLIGGSHHYAQGQWAASLNYSKGVFYLYFISYGRDGVDNTKNIMLTTSDPEGIWEMQEWPEHYYDSGWLFDDGENGDGYVYVACGIGDIYVNKLNGTTLKKISSTKILSHDTKDYYNAMEGSHMYHIGDYYYVYVTTGGYYRGQQIFRSKNPMGPYEECPYMVFENQAIHQGALVDTPTGEWWTVLFKDAGSIGRVPYLEPVTWSNDWPIVGNKGVDVSKNGVSFRKPAVVVDPVDYTNVDFGRTYLPTNDTFTDPKLGMQWEWNHNPDNSAWSLFEHPGNLRLHTVSVTEDLISAHNSLSQRIMGYVPEGTITSKVINSYGTVKMDISHMVEGDVAGLAVFQNPYSFIAVKMVDGKKVLYSERCTFDGQKLNKEETKLGDEIDADSIYLRAIVNFGTNTCKYYYSLDNSKWTLWGCTMTMRFTLDIFVGQRFYIFNYATRKLGGFVDVDWFSTEPSYSEERYFGEGVLNTFTEEDLTMEFLELAKTDYLLTVGTAQALEIICTAKSGMKSNVASNCKYASSNPEVATVVGGRIMTLSDGETEITATYSDIFGNEQSLAFTVKVSTFPLSEDAFNPSIYGTGTYKYVASQGFGQLKTSQYGFGGWQYNSGVDLSRYNYIVVRLRTVSTCNPSFRLFDTNNYWADPYIMEIGRNKEVVIDLHNMVNSKGEKVDPSHIYIAGFWTTGSASMYIKEVFVSDNGVDPTAIEGLTPAHSEGEEAIYNLAGQKVGEDYKGIVIRNGRKILVR